MVNILDLIIVPEVWTANSSHIAYHYKRDSDRTLWNVSRVEYNTVHIWAVNANGVTYRESVNRYEFEQTFTRVAPKLHSSGMYVY